MTAKEIRIILEKLRINLEAHRYEPCHAIIQELEERYNESRKLTQSRRDELECLASLPLDLRWINMLEKAGYIYLKDLDGVDILNLSLPQLGPEGRRAIYNAVKKARAQLDGLQWL